MSSVVGMFSSTAEDRQQVQATASYVLITGLQAAGKSTVGRALAERFAKGAFVEGDDMAAMILSGREHMSLRPSTEARRQLQLRYDLGVEAATTLRTAGFVAVHADIVLGEAVLRCEAAARPGQVRIVMLNPEVSAIAGRERSRNKRAYEAYAATGQSLEDVIRSHAAWINETPQLGIRVDSTDQTVEETVDEIIQRWDQSVVPPNG